MLGISYYNITRTDEAIESLEKSISLNPDQPTVKETLGTSFLNKGTEALSNKEFEAATALFKKAGDYSPNNGYIYYNLAESYLFTKNYASAEKALNQASRLMPQNADVLQRLGLVYEKMKKWNQALSAYKKAQGMNPSKSLKDAIARAENNKKQ